MKKNYLLCVLLFFTLQSFSQKEILVGEGKYKAEQNVEEYISGKRKLLDVSSYKGKNYVLLQFRGIPSELEKKRLKAKGIELNSYVHNNTYYAQIQKGELADQLSATSIISIHEINALSKTSKEILDGIIPDHAKVTADIAKVNVIYFEGAEMEDIKCFLQSHNMRLNHSAEEFNVITIDMPIKSVNELAVQPWVKWIEYIGLPLSIDNIQGRTMNRCAVLSERGLGGRNLTGKGIKVGVWDANAQQHPDLGERLHSMEYERVNDHGMHVSGTVAGAGLIDPRAKGMAPEANLYNYNFGNQSNGLSAQQEMMQAVKDFDITITQNSYGVSLRGKCDYVAKYSSENAQIDQIVNQYYPTLTHVFSAGNNQSDCLPNKYSTSTKRSKNIILVGALDETTQMSDFSSWGPMNDGRLLPHISSFGVQTYSTIYDNKYGFMSGTSMATPAVSGTIALLYQRYQQLKGEKPLASLIKAAVCNTAQDKGNPGPDYSFGYGAINALRAVKTLENKQFAIASVENGEDFTFEFSVPDNAVDLKVMLVWSDYYGTVSTKKALVNDLDLVVSNNGTITQPWVLDASEPSKDAFRGVDHLNNIEQVTYENPKGGMYSVKVTGTEVPKGPQQFAVVFYYNTPSLEMIYPNGNEKFKPGEKVAVRWESFGHSGMQAIEFSSDNGISFKSLAKGIPNSTNDMLVTLPDVITNKAILRVIQNGTMDVSNTSFVMAPVPTDLKISTPDCGVEGFSLTWKAVEGADKYEILKADVNKGVYTKIGESTSPIFTLPTLTKERNIFSVTSVFGEVVSERAYAIIVNPSVPLNLAAIELPFEETFDRYPSDYVQVINDEGTNFGYVSSVFSYKQAHSLYMSGSESTTEWDATGDVFAKNPKDVVSAKICQIDTEGISGPLWLRVAAQVFNTGEPTNANLRVLANGDQLTNTFGKEVVHATPSGENIMYWDLSSYAGKSISLEFQAALRNPKDSVQLGFIKLYQPKYDVGISNLSSAAKASNLTASNDVTVKVKNYSGEEVSDIPVSYCINEGAKVYEVIEGPIAPFARLDYTFSAKANFSTPDRAYHIVANVKLPSDKNEKNNSTEFETANLGNYYLMPNKKSNSNTKKLGAEILKFTDDGARVLNYSNSFEGSVVFKPATKGNKVKIKFIDFDLEENYDKMEIFDGYSYYSSPSIAVLTGSLGASEKEYTATNQDGSLTVLFKSDNKNNALGWYAEVSEVDASQVVTNNILTLSNISAYNGYYPTDEDIRIEVRNNSASVVENVKIQYKIDDGEWCAEENMGTILASTEKDYTFTTLASLLPLGASHTITARVVNVDENMDDNKISKTITNDRYCFAYSGASSMDGTFFITNVEKDKISNSTSTTEQESQDVLYYRSTVFPLYKDALEQALTVEINGHVENGKIGVWIDWNDDGDYSNDGDVSSVLTSKGVLSYQVPLNIPADATLGSKHMRVRSTTGVMDACERYYSNNGEVEDYMIDLQENYPITSDLSVSEITLNSGLNLSATQTVSAIISNNASVDISNFEVAYIIDGGAEVKETVSQEIAAFSTYEYSFTTTADLSVKGDHNIQIYTLASGDMVPENDQLSKKITNSKIEAGGFYALNFDGVDDLLDAGTLKDVNLQDFTYEAWINPRGYGNYGEPGFGRLFQGKGATIFLHGENNQNYPNHCLVVSLGGGAVYTNLNTIELNKWQHVAISFNSTSKEAKVYINGVETSTVIRSAIGDIADNSDSHLYIGNNTSLKRAFNGMIDEARVWSDVRSVDEVKSGLYNHVAGSEEGLLAQFSFDEGFYNAKAYSGAISADIINAEIKDVEGSIWKSSTQLLSDIKFENQVSDFTDLGSNTSICEVSQVTDLTKLIANYSVTYPNVSVVVNHEDQESGTSANDFSNSLVSPVRYDFSITMFGKTLSETHSYSVKKEASTACDLLSFGFLKTVNSDLSDDIDCPEVKQFMLLDVANSMSVDALKPSFTISEGAKVFVNGSEITSGLSALDFSQPLVISVLAANGRNENNYSVSLRKSQTTNWIVGIDKKYGDIDFKLNAVATSGLPLTYSSSNTNVMLVAGGVAHIVGTGEVTVTADQFGHNTMLASESVQKIFKVVKAKLTATADDKAVDYTRPIPELSISYTGWVNGESAEVIDELPTVSTLAVQNSVAGDYDINLTGGSDSNYDITLENGTLTINDVPAYKATFSITNGTDAIEGATVQINEQNLISDVNGKVVVELINGEYVYAVSKEGMTDYSASITITDSKVDEMVVMTLPLPVYTLSYSADENGIIIGDKTQEIEKGSDGVEVIATANNGYHFVKWSDGVNTAARTDLDVQSDLAIEAQFEINTYQINYSAGLHGTISGETSQTLTHGANASSVEATANVGYLFVQWSDGVKTNPRTDENIDSDMDITAEYTLIYTLPYTQNFDENTMPIDWQNVSNKGNTDLWEFKTKTLGLKGSEGNFAILDSDEYGGGTQQDADLISPIFDLKACTSVNLKFKHYFKEYNSSTATLSYCIDGGEWVTIESWTGTSTENPAIFDKEIMPLAGQSNVRFKWNYVGAYAYYWCIDDIELTGVIPSDNYTVVYEAGVNGGLSGDLNQVVDHGADATTVTAVANSGYIFLQWSDGKTDNPRTDIGVTKNISVTAMFTKDCKPITSLPYLEDFDTSTSVPDCWTIPETTAGYTWEFGSFLFYGTPKTIGTTGNNAFFNSTTTDGGEIQMASLISPVFDLSLYSSVNLSFTHMFKKFKDETIGELYYSVDDEDTWVSVKKWDESMYHAEDFSQLIDAIGGQASVKFKLTYQGASDYGWIVDDIQVSGVAKYILTYTAGENGSLTGSLVQAIEKGFDATVVTAVADAGYHFTQWSDGETANPRTDLNVQSDITVTAEFVADPTPEYTLSYTAGEHGSLEGSLVQTVEKGSDATVVTAVADAGYHFTQWSDGVTANPRTDLNVQTDMTVTAEFVADPTPEYTLSYTAGEHGSLEGSLVQTVEKGSDATAVKAVADAGYHFTQWSDGSTANPRTDLNVQSDITVTAEFVIDPTPEYTLSYTAGEHGSLTGTLVQTIEKGSDATAVKAVADAGYHFTKWSDGSTANPRTDLNVQSDITVTAEFVVDPTPEYTLSYTAGEHGSLTGTLVQTIEKGSDATAVKAVADASYHFTQWSDGETANPRTDTHVQSNMTVTAEFAANVYSLKFVVSSIDNFLSGIIISINDQELTTNILGEAEIMLENGTYDYSILIDGSSVHSGSLTISGEDRLETVTLTTTGIDEVVFEEIRVYPNPVVEQLILEKLQAVKLISVRSINGRTIDIIKPNGLDKIYYNTSKLSSGMYLFCVEYLDGKRTVKKVIKE